MRSLRRGAAILVFAVAALGGLAPSASAYGFAPTDGTPPFTASGTNSTFTFSGGNAVVECSATASGATSSGLATFAPTYSGCTVDIAGISWTTCVSVNAAWTAQAMSKVGSVYRGTLTIPPVAGSGSSLVFTVYDDVACTPSTELGHIYIDGHTTAATGWTAVNSGLNLNWSTVATAITWSADGDVAAIIGSFGADGVYNTNGNLTFFGVNIT